MNYSPAVILLAALPILFQQARPDEAKQHSCPMQAMTDHAVENQNTAADAAPQSAEQRHHAFLAEEREAIARGEGFGMAFAADHNGYPGPRHVLALQEELKLAPDQVSAMQEIFAQMREQALTRGKDMLQAEDRLEQMFRDHRPEAELQDQVFRVNSLRAELRWVHLRAHLSAARLLTPEQIVLYGRLRHGQEHETRLLAAAFLSTTIVCAQDSASTAPAAGPWKSLQFLVGTWEAKTQGGSAGVAGSGAYTFQLELRNHVLARHSTSEGCKGPEAYDCGHTDLLYVYQDSLGQAYKAIYFDNEGHVIHYDVSTPSATTAVFLSDSSQPGPQFRLTYELRGSTMYGKFQMRMPGKAEFKSYLEWSGMKK